MGRKRRNEPFSCYDCRPHLKYRQAEWQETHGLDCGPYERCFEEWWECSFCGQIYTAEDLERLCKRNADTNP